MPSNTKGPIAKSYDELQGIDSLDQAFKNGLSDLSLDDLIVRTVLQCLILADLNCEQLCTRQIDAMTVGHGGIAAAHQHSLWHLTIVSYSCELLDFAVTRCPHEQGLRGVAGSAHSDYFSRYNDLAHVLLTSLNKNEDYRRKVVVGFLSEPVASIAHTFKNIYLLNQIASYKRRMIQIPLPLASNDLSVSLNESMLRSAFSTLSLLGDTYFSQFRLLHQIPELLARCANEHLNAALIHDISPSHFTFLLSTIIDHIRLIRLSIPCILHLMTPREYYEIRENLGVTSGSHSRMLGLLLSTGRSKGVGEAAERHIHGSGDDVHLKAFIASLLRQYRQEVLSWRDTHVGLPRNVLGGFGTKSLIGNDAVTRVQDMRDDSLGKPCPISLEPAKGAIADHGMPAFVQDLDTLLLKLTSDMTKGRFPHVQNRTGPVFGGQPNVKGKHE